ncbi:MAG TPA: CHAT domain-containing protein [Gemmatimonadales bacterium]|nr:CHAT domain-containing protein [Gemmatimonadales bacterium]
MTHLFRAPLLLAVALTTLTVVAAAQAPDDPRTVARLALRAVEADGAPALRARWGTRLAARPDDRAAALGMATLDRLAYDYAAADRRYQALAGEADSADRYGIYALIGEGQGLDTRGHLAEAGQRLGRARALAHRAGDRQTEGEALLWQSFIRAQAEGVAAGFAILDTVHRLLPSSALAARAELLRRRSALFAISGQADSAAALSVACRDLARRAAEPRTEATCLRAQAYSLSAQNLADSALAILAQVERLQRGAHDHGGLAITLLFATDPYLNTGRYGTAKAMLEKALVEAKLSHDDNSVAAVHTGLGSLGLRFADYLTADAELRQASEMFSQQGDTNDATVAVSFQAYLAAATGDLERARGQYAQVIAWQQRIGNARGEYDDRLQLAEVELRVGDDSAAALTLDAARRLARRTNQPNWLSELGYEEARLAVAQGDLRRAEARLADYIKTRDSTEHLQRHLGRTRLAEVYARSGDVARAEQELGAAGDELDRWRATLADRELRLLAFQASAGDHRSRDASIARVLAAMVRAGRAAPAFELAERRRARELLERLTQAEALRADSGPAPAAGARRHEPLMVTAAAAAAALPDDGTALLEYVAGIDGAPSTVFVVTRRGVEGRVLPPADSLIATIERFVALLEDGQDPRDPAGVLGPVLLDSALALLPAGVTRILVVPDGPLHRLPFDALRLADGRYVVERYTVGVVPSAGALATLRERPVRPDTQGTAVLALGDPAFAREQGERAVRGELFRDAFDRSGGLPRLAAAGDEVRDVARYAPSAVVRVRGDASEAFVKHTPLERFGVLHFATHALVDESTLARTALALSPGDGEDGFLSPADLAALRLNADLVVLSACRTAGGVIVAGEGLQGLTAPLLVAGARSVVATQWRIGDRSTVQLVDEFYEAMAAGRPVAEALRAAKLAAIRRGAPPRDWAAFTVVGDPEARVKLSRPAPRPSLWWVAAAGAALVLGGLFVRRRGEDGERGAVP